MISRKQCINIPTATYSGKEMSPLRYGISAEEFDIGVVKKGHDGLNWIVKMKNTRKVWVRIYIPCNKMVHEIHSVEKPETEQNEEEISTDTKTEDNDNSDNVNIIDDEEQPIIKAQEQDVQKKVEKKHTNYNIFLTYRLHKLKETYAGSGEKKSNKEIFAEVLLEWKNIDKTSTEYDKIMKEAMAFKKSK